MLKSSVRRSSGTRHTYRRTPPWVPQEAVKVRPRCRSAQIAVLCSSLTRSAGPREIVATGTGSGTHRHEIETNESRPTIHVLREACGERCGISRRPRRGNHERCGIHAGGESEKVVFVQGDGNLITCIDENGEGWLESWIPGNTKLTLIVVDPLRHVGGV